MHRKTKKGVSFEQMKQGAIEEKSGFLVFESKTTGSRNEIIFLIRTALANTTFSGTVIWKLAAKQARIVEAIEYLKQKLNEK